MELTPHDLPSNPELAQDVDDMFARSDAQAHGTLSRIAEASGNSAEHESKGGESERFNGHVELNPIDVMCLNSILKAVAERQDISYWSDEATRLLHVIDT